jgi:selenide,water dikinase
LSGRPTYTIEMTDVALTKYAHGSGCGCKIAPAVLEKILHQSDLKMIFPQLLVGNETRDDAAVFELDSTQCLISTTDFFMPIVDNAYDFGRIAAANAISDVYAMGGRPIMAIAILGWPVDKLAPELAQRVLEGGRTICHEAGIPLAGGHSVDSPEPFFGLAVTGLAEKQQIKRNSTAQPGDSIYLTKPIGVGILTTASKRGLATPEDVAEAVRLMTQLNSVGAKLGLVPGVTAMTDVTGFGLLGHLLEVCEGSGLSAEIHYPRVPLARNLKTYLAKMIYPDNTMRNWGSYQSKVDGIGSESLLTLCDPQTSGGLMVFVKENEKAEVEELFRNEGIPFSEIGHMMTLTSKLVFIRQG